MKFGFPTICALASCLAVSAAGQTPVRDFAHAVQASPFLEWSNPASMGLLGNVSFSDVSASLSKDDGSLISLERSGNSFSAGVGTESYKRISDKIAFCGGLSYSYFLGEKMGGPVLINPDANAISFLEEDLSTAGRKKRETYSLKGGMAYSFTNRLTAGFMFDYQAVDQVKYKDPRTMSVLVDLTVSPGLMFTASDLFSAGCSFIYRHSVEQLSAGLYGTVDRTYYFYVDQGAYYGRKELFVGDEGYISDSNSRPMSNDYFGLAIQTVSGSRVKLHNQLEALFRQGYYGTRSSGTVVFCEFGGPQLSYQGSLLIPSGNNLQRLDFDASYKGLNNSTNSYKYHVETGQNTTVEYHGQNKTLARHDIDGSLSYTIQRGTDAYLPKWDLNAGADFGLRMQSTTVYPNKRKYNHIKYAFHLDAKRNIQKSSDVFGFGLSALFAAGAGNPAKDNFTSSGGASIMKSFDDYLHRQFEYNTAARLGAGLEFTYTRIISQKFAPYVKISDNFLSLLSKPEYLDGATRNVALLTLGCNF